MNKVLKRMLTALVGAAIMLGCMFSGTYGHVFIFGLITLMSLYELQSMGAQVEGSRFDLGILDRLSYIGFGLLAYGVLSAVFLKWISFEGLLILPPALILMFTMELYRNKGSAFINVGKLTLGLLYIALPMALANKLSHPTGEFDLWYTLIAMGVVWIHDVFAYFIGRTWGKRPLFKRISPNKTWEGTFGGIFGVLLIISALALKTGLFTPKTWLIFGLVAALGATFGDLFESLLKRSVGVKDSGSVLPGHGGFLDRFDALFFVIPIILVVLLAGGYISF